MLTIVSLATVLGLIIGQGTYVGVSYILSYIFAAAVPRIVTGEAVGQAIGLGIIIPILASIFPIISALGHSLRESLDTSRSKTVAVKYKLERSDESSLSFTLAIIGGCMTIFGFAVYYSFPLALLSFNFSLMLYLFFGVLLLMLLGLVVLGLNFEVILNTMITYGLFFWENEAIRVLMLKNMSAHRIRNRKTTVIYSLSLGFVVWVAVVFNIQIMSYQYDIIQGYGTRMNIQTRIGELELNNKEYVNRITKFLASEPIASKYAFWSFRLSDASGFQLTEGMNTGMSKTGMFNNVWYLFS